MLTYLRYTLAAGCFAASVGCLLLWWRTASEKSSHYTISYHSISGAIYAQLLDSQVHAYFSSETKRATGYVGRLASSRKAHASLLDWQLSQPQFGRTRRGYKYGVTFPIWYPALIVALAGVGVLRFRRQFSIRSALVCLTMVAALLGMAVVL